ncbi:putative disease resistance protein RGA1 [Quercus robur]|uniref:putative disease resistance protein RGA1 n=1 Tax=Quercus robur TaxID=38942 RepID=UPI00216375BF|nr:putative disease resistance protein RGA1 [Quercus robur]XP_050282976.1 putative disease resistance protein RGA1 [Quercus robur]XP_050282978.1 putative disease resistance protein RGA1 [Quercus robur]XP_050282979.1 putative disease resistance protein RGA1 [Quercus robur]
MAEGALFDLAGNVLKLLGSVIVEEVKLASSVETEIIELTNTVSTIRDVLLDAEKQSSHNHQIKDCLSWLKDVLHDADDLLDDFSTEVMRRKMMTKKVRLFSACSNPLAFSPKMGREIKAIREKINAIAILKEDFHFNQSLVEPRVMTRWDTVTISSVLDDEVIGREDDKKEIMVRLFDGSVVENISIIPIVGFGGLGKTTLAHLVYNDKIVQQEFEIKLWVCISDDFDVQRIVKEILEQLTDERLKESFEMLQTQLREKLNGKKYLIVLDDLWNEESDKWLLLRNLLMGGARGSRIIVTTRSENVARITGATSWHALRGLPEEQAWCLFVKVAFENGQVPKNEAFLSLGREIMQKCAGVPLAIRTIASLLRTKATENEWRSFKDYELPKMTQNDENVILSSLQLSYDYLPSYLKQCFAYCGLFPKGYRINVYTLVNLWVANRFIVLEDSKQCFEDVGRGYFMKLLWRSFFDDVESDGLGNIKSCKMNNLVRDLAVRVSGTEIAVINSSGNNVNNEVRHVLLNLVNSSMPFSILMHNGSKVRTVLISSVWGNLGNLTCDALISNLNYLRALDLSYLELHVVPRSIGKLKHLRYLDLSGNYYIKILPNSITKMLNLQTLILESCHSLGELPRGIKKLVNLRYLDITNCDELTNVPLEIKHLTSLEIILPCLVVRMGSSKGKSIGPSDLKELHNLGGELRIENLGHGKDDVLECKDANLKDKQHLQQLSLKWDDSEDKHHLQQLSLKWDDSKPDDSKWDGESECYDEKWEVLRPHSNLKWLWLENYMEVRIPSWVPSLTNLVYFVLRKNKRLQHLPLLNKFPSLKFISLHGMEALEYIQIDEDSVSNVSGASSSSSSFFFSKTPFFPSLSSLCIAECPKLKGWRRNEPHHFLLPTFPPPLSTLRIRDCPNLTSMPPFPYLKERLKLSRCSWKVAICCPLPLLDVLSLKDVEDLELLFQEIRNLTSLKKLRICQCPELTSLPQEICNLTSLKELRIYECPKLTSLPQEICNLTSLKELRIYECPELTSLPQEICNLTSLKELRIYQCPELTSLPPEIYNLTSLKELRIDQCPLLWQKMKEANR